MIVPDNEKHAKRVASKAEALSIAARSVWGKTQKGSDTTFWLPLHRHLADTALVSARLYDSYLPDSAKRDISLALDSDEDARTLAIFLAGIHDLGKASPVFLSDEEDYVNELNDAFMEKNGLHIPRGIDRSQIRHEVISAILVKRFLMEEGVSEAVADSCAIVVGSHHGHPLSHELLAACVGRDDIMGISDPMWLSVQREIFDYAAVISGANKRFADWADMEISRSAETILMGFVVVADWGASKGFGCTMSLKSKSLDVNVEKETTRAVVALNSLPVPEKWVPSVPPSAGAEFFHTRFGFPPRPVQKAALDAVRPITSSGLVIIEAPMGEGKTEAALAVAEVMAQKTGASGVFVALPTIATSDAIFSRARSWVSNLPGSRSGMSMYLSHSRSGLNGTFSELLDAADDSIDGGHVNKWLAQGSKLGPLSNFTVGTIDQVLVSALASRHVTLRHLALANKVVVLDEVHAYDAYMNVFLARALQWLGYYGVPVILLSATLPTDIRKDLVSAYNDGLNSRRSMSSAKETLPLTLNIKKVAKRKSKNEVGGIDLSPLTTIRYPLISVLDNDGVKVHHTEGTSSKHPLELNVMPGGGDNQKLAKRLVDRLQHGGCVGIFRNTVARAQQTYDEIQEYFATEAPDVEVEVLLLHSRFIGLDRAVKEQKLNTYLGKEYSRRPKRLIVVGTQVMEQSLDIDFDESISDIAPIDSLLQRAGRTHRHNIPTRPRIFKSPRLYIAGVSNWDGSEGGAPVVNHSAESIYPLKTLYRAVHALRPYALQEDKRLKLPRDISMLVRRGYGERVRPPASWREEWVAAEKEWRELIADKKDKADSNYLLPSPETDILDWQGHINSNVGDTESKALAQVRDIDDEEEIILLKSDGRGQIQVLGGDFAGANLPVDFETTPSHETALAIAASMMRLRAKEYDALEAESALFDTDLMDAWSGVPILRHKKILVLRENMTSKGQGFNINYSHNRGLEIKVAK